MPEWLITLLSVGTPLIIILVVVVVPSLWEWISDVVSSIWGWLFYRETPYEEMSDDDLRELCLINQIKGYKKLDRDKMIQLLKEFDNGIRKEPSSHKCINCGSNLTRIVIVDDYDEEERVSYECTHCNTDYSEDDVISN